MRYQIKGYKGIEELKLPAIEWELAARTQKFPEEEDLMKQYRYESQGENGRARKLWTAALQIFLTLSVAEKPSRRKNKGKFTRMLSPRYRNTK